MYYLATSLGQMWCRWPILICRVPSVGLSVRQWINLSGELWKIPDCHWMLLEMVGWMGPRKNMLDGENMGTIIWGGYGAECCNRWGICSISV